MNMRHEHVSTSESRGGRFVYDRPPIVMTTADRDSVLALLQREPAEPRVRDSLLEELRRADVVCAVAPRVLVELGSEVTFVDHFLERARRVRIVHPDEAGDRRTVSVLSAMGSALIGLGPGQSIVYADEEDERRLTVLEIDGGQASAGKGGFGKDR
jgi:regulator of nucleoside diphosphate kinase